MDTSVATWGRRFFVFGGCVILACSTTLHIPWLDLAFLLFGAGLVAAGAVPSKP